MLFNYLKVFFRDAARNSFFSLLNVLGLSIGFAACLIIISYISFERGFDDFHVNKDRLFRLAMNVKSGESQGNAATYPILHNLLEKVPQVETSVRLKQKKGIIINEAYPNKKFSEDRIFYADENFFDVFSFKLLAGDPRHVLSEPNSVVLTRSIAEKYFGDLEFNEVLGKTLRKIGTTEDEALEVTGVCEDVPLNSHIQYDFIISYKAIYQWRDDDGSDYKTLAESGTEWPGFYTYVLLEKTSPGSIPDLEKQVTKLFNEVLPPYQQMNKYDFFLQPVRDIHLHSKLVGELSPGGDADDMNILLAVAVLLLTIAVINYVNLSSARTSERFREIGVRKVLGSQRRQIINRFLFESVIFSLASSTVATLILLAFWSLLSPFVGIRFDFNLWNNELFYIFIVGSLLFTTATYSLYPIVVLSSNNPVTALRGGGLGVKGGGFRKALVVFQFTAATVLIAAALIINKQTLFMQDSEKGMQTENMLVVRAPKVPSQRTDYLTRSDAFKSEVANIASVKGVTLGVRIPGEDLSTQAIRREDQSEGTGTLLNILGVDHDYLKTLQLKLLAGRNFSRSHKANEELMSYNEERVNFGSNDHSVIINELAARELGFEKPDDAIGHRVFVFGTKKEIIGVVHDHHHKSMKQEAQATLFYIQLVYGGYYIVNMETQSKLLPAVDLVKAAWDKVYPVDPFEFFFLDDFYNQQYQSEVQFQRIFWAFATLILAISCLGLLALSMFTISKRAKEIAVRKVVGATFTDIVKTILTGFAPLIGISLALSVPMIYFFGESWLSGYPFRITVGLWAFFIPACIVGILTIFIVLAQTWTTVRRTSLQYLRSE